MLGGLGPHCERPLACVSAGAGAIFHCPPTPARVSEATGKHRTSWGPALRPHPGSHLCPRLCSGVCTAPPGFSACCEGPDACCAGRNSAQQPKGGHRWPFAGFSSTRGSGSHRRGPIWPCVALLCPALWEGQRGQTWPRPSKRETAPGEQCPGPTLGSEGQAGSGDGCAGKWSRSSSNGNPRSHRALRLRVGVRVGTRLKQNGPVKLNPCLTRKALTQNGSDPPVDPEPKPAGTRAALLTASGRRPGATLTRPWESTSESMALRHGRCLRALRGRVGRPAG